MDGLLLYTWHRGEPGYDDVSWIPAKDVTEEGALGLALLKLQVDPGAISVQVTNECGRVVAVARAA